MPLIANVNADAAVLVEFTDMAGSSLTPGTFPIEASVRQLVAKAKELKPEWENKDIVFFSEDGTVINGSSHLKDQTKIVVHAKAVFVGDYRYFSKDKLDITDYEMTYIDLQLGHDGSVLLSHNTDVFMCHEFMGHRERQYSGIWEEQGECGFAMSFVVGDLKGKTILGTLDEDNKAVSIDEFREKVKGNRRLVLTQAKS
eukprot:TRINITY_DN20749_c0_g1_i1.p1 TRINITY_DN20749_c0_g1~~TRINITY_DN20749_c0_g1_i1.p1  ORF type:complete len:222 (+),score=28.40 TRINITY_DN20749_c0_g1_i1:72-668(+)